MTNTEEARKKIIEMIEGSLLCETKERDTEQATQIADDIIPIITKQAQKEEMDYDHPSFKCPNCGRRWFDKLIQQGWKPGYYRGHPYKENVANDVGH